MRSIAHYLIVLYLGSIVATNLSASGTFLPPPPPPPKPKAAKCKGDGTDTAPECKKQEK